MISLWSKFTLNSVPAQSQHRRLWCCVAGLAPVFDANVNH